MSVDKIILRAVLTTLASIAILFLFMLTALVCVYPQTMMKLTYDLGMEDASIWFAEISYDRSHEINYIAHAAEVAIGQHDYEKIDSCGERLIKDEAFDDFCAIKNAKGPQNAELTYEQYVYGQVCIAKYERARVTEAVERAFALVGDNAFPKNNAVVAVLITALQHKDADTVNLIKVEMKNMQVRAEYEAYFNAILALTESQ
ncbi:MAG: hypothetical protein IJ308_00930 [Clostridia bacterium]|nr:hypothetical protein [Clostridia bacterium]